MEDASKFAVTLVFPVRVTVQVPVPVQAPDHPVKVDPVAAVDVRTTVVPLVKLELQVVGQLIPDGLLVTVPEPVPVVLTESCTGVAAWSKVAVTVESAPIVTAHLPVPVHAPDQPVNVEVASGVAVRVTCVPPAKLVLQPDPQLMPLGELLTVPPPVPAFLTASWKLTFWCPDTEAQPHTKDVNPRQQRAKPERRFIIRSPETPNRLDAGCAFQGGWVLTFSLRACFCQALHDPARVAQVLSRFATRWGGRDYILFDGCAG